MDFLFSVFFVTVGVVPMILHTVHCVAAEAWALLIIGWAIIPIGWMHGVSIVLGFGGWS